MTIHSDETREKVVTIFANVLWQDKSLSEMSKMNLISADAAVNEILELLAKEQTRLLDRVLEGLPKKHDWSVEPADEWENASWVGHNKALSEVTTTIQKLKGEIV